MKAVDHTAVQSGGLAAVQNGAHSALIKHKSGAKAPAVQSGGLAAVQNGLTPP